MKGHDEGGYHKGARYLECSSMERRRVFRRGSGGSRQGSSRNVTISSTNSLQHLYKRKRTLQTTAEFVLRQLRVRLE